MKKSFMVKKSDRCGTHLFIISNTFISNARLKFGRNQAIAKQYPKAELLRNMSKKQISMYQWDYTNNENENGNGIIDHINKTYIDQDLDKHR